MEKGSSASSAAAESLNGLKFGKKIYFGDVGTGSEPKTGGGPPSYPAKKGKSEVAHGGQPPRCQVEGCLVDLSDAKAYYSRHKVCGMHSKSSTVVVAGIAQRFCQQCSRFHKLTEFDQGKRSCRRRLACHNERRRKPAPGPMLSPHFGTLSPTTILSPTMLDSHRKTGDFLMDFSIYSTPTGRESWPNNTTPNGGFGNQLQLPWQTNLQNPLPPLLQSSTTARPSYSTSVDCFTGVVSDSSSALSLLSIQPPWASRSRASSIGINGFLGGGTNTNANGTTTALFQQPVNNPIGQFTCPPDVGLGQISNHVSGQYGGELGLAQPMSHGQFHELDHSRGYGSFI